MDEFLGTLILASTLSALFISGVVGLEVARRRFGYSPEITRRVVHIFSGLCTLVDYLLLPPIWFIILISVSLVGIAASQKFGWLTSVHSVRRRTYGEVFLPIGTLATYCTSALNLTESDWKYFVPALMIMTFADSASGITSDVLKLQRKSWRGSLVFALVSSFILLSFGLGVIKALAFAMVLTAVERFSKLGSDNLTVPLTGSLLLRFF
ncbi:MAG: hypothetical protein RLZZ380_86 [Actinomycetota bacterium]|jgi:dolichol kinase